MKRLGCYILLFLFLSLQCLHLRKDVVSSSSSSTANSSATLGSNANTVINSSSQANNINYNQIQRQPIYYPSYYPYYTALNPYGYYYTVY